MRGGTSRAGIGELSFDEPSTAYGAVAPERRSEPRRGWRVLAQVLAATAACSVLLAFGAGRIGAGMVDVEDQRRAARADQVVLETTALIAALPFDEVAALDGTSLPDTESAGNSDFRIDLAVTAVDRGLQVAVTLLDARTRLPVREFVAWRGRV